MNTRRVAYYYVTKDGCPCTVSKHLHHNWVLIPASLKLAGAHGFLWDHVHVTHVVPNRRTRLQAYRTCEAMIARTVAFRKDHQQPTLIDDYLDFKQATKRGTFKIVSVSFRKPKPKSK